MYYIIETQYVGPNKIQDEYIDVNKIEISTSPAFNNCSHQPQINGWCGTNNDWAVFALGECVTIEEARTAITEMFGEVRESEPNDDSFNGFNECIVEVYKPGKYVPIGSQSAAYLLYEEVQAHIEAETTDERIAELVAENEAEANSYGYTLGQEPESFMLSYREELRDELEDNA